MDLTIIIINYNVKHFIAQCIDSINKANKANFQCEIIVVDNNSSDGSHEFLKKVFPSEVKFIWNKKNVGFGAGCNLGIEKAQGEYILFLNPDTVISEDTLTKSLESIKQKKNIGALGVKLVDGQGKFLIESKRSFPTIWNSFSKLIGLSALFPQSRFFSSYNMTFQNENTSCNVDVLCGAFILIPRKVIEKVGNFDESFFMYGEDIDLCYRIKELGLNIIYDPCTSIIHYKGESRKEKDLGYYKNFYNAMSIYSDKHNIGITRFFLKLSILLAGLMAIVYKKLLRVVRYILDIVILFIGFEFLKYVWALIVYNDIEYYRFGKIDGIIMFFSILSIFSLIISGHYNKLSSLRNTLAGTVIGGIMIITIYSILPLDLRFSRALTLLYIPFVLAMTIFSQMLYNSFRFKKFTITGLISKRIAVVGSESSESKVSELLSGSSYKISNLGRITYSEDYSTNIGLGHLNQLGDLINIYNLDEVVFCTDDIQMNTIFQYLTKYGKKVEFKLFSDSKIGVVGSSNVNRPGNIYTSDLSFKIDNRASRFLKRTFDILFSLVSLILSPIIIFVNPKVLLHLIDICKGQFTWVGYNDQDEQLNELPILKKCIIPIVGNSNLSQELIHEYNINYAMQYSILLDIEYYLRFIFTKNKFK